VQFFRQWPKLPPKAAELNNLRAFMASRKHKTVCYMLSRLDEKPTVNFFKTAVNHKNRLISILLEHGAYYPHQSYCQHKSNTGDVFTMCFILTMNYTMKISLQQHENFVIRVGLSL